MRMKDFAHSSKEVIVTEERLEMLNKLLHKMIESPSGVDPMKMLIRLLYRRVESQSGVDLYQSVEQRYFEEENARFRA